MALAPPIVYHLPSVGPHVCVLVDQIDLGWKPNQFDATKPDRHMNKLIFLTDDTTSYPGELLFVQTEVNLVRSPKGNLINFIRSWNNLPDGKAPIPSHVSWDTEDYIGRCLGTIIVHNGTWANIDSTYVTSKTLAIPAGYIRKSQTPIGTYNATSSTTSTTTLSVNQPKPPAPAMQAAQSTVQAVKAVLTEKEMEEVGYIPF